jgi:hypothetical protein
MSEFKFDKNAMVLFDNHYGLQTDGQVVDRWVEEGEAWYAVIDCGTPDGDERELPEDRLKAYR